MQDIKFKKGDLVRIRPARAGVTRRVFSVATPDDKLFGNILLHDDRFYIVTKPSTRIVVPRIVVPPGSTRSITKICEVFDPIAGDTLIVRRNDFEKAEEIDVQAAT
jgi:hypothetical protein